MMVSGHSTSMAQKHRRRSCSTKVAGNSRRVSPLQPTGQLQRKTTTTTTTTTTTDRAHNRPPRHTHNNLHTVSTSTTETSLVFHAASDTWSNACVSPISNLLDQAVYQPHSSLCSSDNTTAFLSSTPCSDACLTNNNNSLETSESSIDFSTGDEEGDENDGENGGENGGEAENSLLQQSLQRDSVLGEEVSMHDFLESRGHDLDISHDYRRPTGVNQLKRTLQNSRNNLSQIKEQHNQSFSIVSIIR